MLQNKENPPSFKGQIWNSFSVKLKLNIDKTFFMFGQYVAYYNNDPTFSLLTWFVYTHGKEF